MIVKRLKAPLAALFLATAIAAVPVPAPAQSTAIPGQAEAYVKDIEAARLGAAVPAFSPRSPGHLRFVAPAAAQQIVDGAGRPLGYLFGAASLVYDIDPADEAVVHYNIGETWGLEKPAKGQPLKIEAKGIAWINLDGPQADPKAILAALPPFAARTLDPKIAQPAIDFAAARLSGDKQTLWAAIDLGGDQWLYYGYDSDTSREQLIVAKPLGRNTQAIKYREDYPKIDIIDDRPVGRTRQAPEVYPFETRSIDIKLVEEAGELGHAWTTMEYGFLRDTPGRLILNLTDEALDVKTEERVRRVEGRIISVTAADGKLLPFVCRKNVLLVELPRPMRKGEVARLKFEYTTPLMRYGGDRNWTLFFGWYPAQLGSTRRTHATFHAEVRVLKPLTVVGSGRVLRRWSEGEHNCVELEEKRPSAFPVISGGPYFPFEHLDAKGRSITVVSYAMERKHGQQKLAKLFAGLVEVYEKLLPPYPFASLSIVEANDWGFGQAPTAYIRITQEAFNPLAGEESQYFSRYANEIFAHEVGHGWWPRYFIIPSREDEWFSESFAEYVSAWVLDVARKQGDMKRMSNAWRSDAKDIKAKVPIVAANRLAGVDAGLYRQRLLYNKGPWVLHCLRSEIGDEAFFTLLRSFLRSFDGKVVRTEDFLGLLEFITKKDYRPWFDKYVYGAELPELARK